ncbi:hypothetical protein CUJ84_Chr000174 [Rhizobium leguminosarum]|uniref:Uncharacterized protein n=1 Tax=Rhizobium leguminosarum TaxID=384 RepID=A0A2K9YX88_RHILE|nr:hypothetical protein CUJ84_Chr000174 [Rhizobium leguminosarum]
MIGGDNRQVSPLAGLILLAFSDVYIRAEIDEGMAAALLSPFHLCYEIDVFVNVNGSDEPWPCPRSSRTD